MSINRIEMQDDKGNTYYPHTDASIVKYGDSDVGTALSELAYEKVSRTITVGTGQNFATLQAAINSIKKYILYGTIIKIEVNPGTYAEDITVGGFYGCGEIHINDNKAPITIKSCLIDSCKCLIKINNLTLNSTDNHAIAINNSNNVVISQITAISATTKSGVIAFGTNDVQVIGSTISNHYGGIVGYNNSKISSSNNAGTGNTIGLLCGSNGEIGKDGTQPSGTAAESSAGGGVIR